MAKLKMYGAANKKQPVVHKGANGCMNIAFYFIKEIVKGCTIKASDIELLKGGSPQSGDAIICGSCKKNVVLIHAEGWCE